VIKSVDIEKFEKRLGYAFKDPKYLLEALTHPSFSSTNRSDNQRLEFIGDRVLGLIVAEAIAKQDPNASEGKLAPRFNALVRKEACSGVAQEIDLGLVLKLGRSEMITGGRRKKCCPWRCHGSCAGRNLFRWWVPSRKRYYFATMGKKNF